MESYFVLGAFLVLISWAIARFSFLQMFQNKLLSLGYFYLKFFFGIALWAIYTFYYTNRLDSDIYKYFDDAQVICKASKAIPAEACRVFVGKQDSFYTAGFRLKNWNRNFNSVVPFNENRTMIRMNVLMGFLSFQNIHIHTLLFAFLSYLGVLLLIHSFQIFAPHFSKIYLLASVSFPSFLLWSSGGLKESVIILGVGFVIWGAFSWSKLNLWKSTFSILGGMVLLVILKYFLALCFLPVLASFFLYKNKFEKDFILLKYATLLISSICLVQFSIALKPSSNFIKILAKKQKHALAEARYSQAGSFCEVPVLDSTLITFIKKAPIGILNCLYKPTPWFSKNPMMLLAALENILILFLALLSVYFLFKNQPQQTFPWNSFLLFAVLICLYFSIIGLLSPVLGNLVRYRIVVYPLLIFCLTLPLPKLSFLEKKV